jgi:hypothetical protein
MARTKQAKSKVVSIQYVHDPEAAKEWMELFVEITKKQFLKLVLNKDE